MADITQSPAAGLNALNNQITTALPSTNDNSAVSNLFNSPVPKANQSSAAPNTSTPSGAVYTPPPVAKPTTVVNSSTATNQAGQIQNTVNNASQQQTNQQNQLYYASNGFVTPYGLSQGATPVQANDPAAAKTTTTNTTGNTNGSSSGSSTTSSAEDAIVNAPDEGMQEAYNATTGQRDDQPIGALQPGFTSQNPLTRTDVVNSVSAGDGYTYKQFSDGTYGRFNSTDGSYVASSASEFNAAQGVQSTTTALQNLNNGILTANQQGQINSMIAAYQSSFQALQSNQTAIQGGMNTGPESSTFSLSLNKALGETAITVANKQIDLAKQIETMQQAFLSDDTDAVKNAYSEYTSDQTQIQKTLDDAQSELDKQTDEANNKQLAYFYQQIAAHPDAGITPDMSTAQIQQAITTSQTFKEKQTLVDNTAYDGGAPDPSTANIPSSITNLTPNELFQNSYKVVLEGVSPKVLLGGGLGSSTGQMGAAIQAIVKNSAAMVAAAGVDAAALQTEWKANSTALSSLTTTMASIQSNVASATSQVQGVLTQFSNSNVNLYDPTFLNQTLNNLSKSYFNSDQIRTYQGEVTEVQNTYSQIFQRGGMSTDASNTKAASIVNGDMTLQDFEDVTQGLQSQATDLINGQIDTANKTATGGSMDQVTKFLKYINSAPISQSNTSTSSTSTTSTGSSSLSTGYTNGGAF